MPRKPIPEELLTEKQKRDRKYRQDNKKYAKRYSKFYYLKKLLEDPKYNKKRHEKYVKKKPKQSTS